MFSVTEEIWLRASSVKNAWWDVSKTLGKDNKNANFPSFNILVEWSVKKIPSYYSYTSKAKPPNLY